VVGGVIGIAVARGMAVKEPQSGQPRMITPGVTELESAAIAFEVLRTTFPGLIDEGQVKIEASTG